MKLILPVVAAVMTFAAIGAVPAMASQAASAQPAQASHFALRQISPSTSLGTYYWENQNRNWVGVSLSGLQFGWTGLKSEAAPFNVVFLGYVNSPAGWPFEPRFDSLYRNQLVVQFQQVGGGGGCLQTDRLHSGVFDAPCGSHNSGTYWALVPINQTNAPCSAGSYWLVNVGITNQYDPYPYGFAMYAHPNGLIYVGAGRPLGGDDQWCPMS